MHFVRVNNLFIDLEKISWIETFVNSDFHKEGVGADAHFEEELIELEGKEARQLIDYIYGVSKNK